MRLNARIAKSMRDAAYREAVLTTPACGAGVCHFGSASMAERSIDGMLFLNESQDPSSWTDRDVERMLHEWVQFAPRGVEADPAYLAVIARAAVKAWYRVTAAGLHHADVRDHDARNAARHRPRRGHAALPVVRRH